MEDERELTRMLAVGCAMAATQLVHGDYDVLEAMTRGRHLSEEELRRAVADYGRRLVEVPEGEWEYLDWRRVPGAEPPTYDVSVPMWTEQGECDLTLELRLVEVPSGTYGIEVQALHIVPRRPRRRIPRPSPTPSPRERRSWPVRSPGARLIPERWRPALAQIVHRLITGDYAGLSRDGFLAYPHDPADVGIGSEIERYPAKLVDLPEEVWTIADCIPIEQQPNAWWAVIPIWEEGGPSDLSLEVEVRDDGSMIEVKVQDVHAL